MKTRAMRIWLLALLLFAAGVALAGDLLSAFRVDDEKLGLAALALARQAMAYAIHTREPLAVPASLPPVFRRRGAVFVSTMDPRTGAPRCCMGTLTPREETLAQEIIANAHDAAVCDKRFPALTAADLAHLRIIVSIIGDSRPIADPATLDPVTDGLAACGPKEIGVVLPGETPDVSKMITWARVRAGAGKDTPVRYLKLNAIRYIEPALRKGINDATSSARH